MSFFVIFLHKKIIIDFLSIIIFGADKTKKNGDKLTL
jgi:hypothetical protein